MIVLRNLTGSRLLAGGMLAVLVPIALLAAQYAVRVIDAHPLVWWGIDLDIMRELGRRWLDTGSMYLPYQVTGSYSVEVQLPLTNTPAMYPPAAGPIFGALSLLPWPLAVVAWWGVPLGILGYAFARWRPSPVAWALVVLMFCHPMTSLQVMVGGTSMWMAALTAAGFLWGWPSALILIKPTFLPFALVGARDRRWWPMALGIVVLTLLGPWQDYIAVARNASDVGYVLTAIPLLLVPVIGWLGRTKAAPEGAASRVWNVSAWRQPQPRMPKA